MLFNSFKSIYKLNLLSALLQSDYHGFITFMRILFEQEKNAKAVEF